MGFTFMGKVIKVKFSQGFLFNCGGFTIEKDPATAKIFTTEKKFTTVNVSIELKDGAG
jgi:hypothetical protein